MDDAAVGTARLAVLDLQVLAAVAASPEVPPNVARRARLVLDEHRRACGEGGPDTGGSEWLHRYINHGVAGLEDRVRSGRPRQIGRTVETETLLAPLFSPNQKWTTRSVAQQVGISQSSVSRIWKHAFDPTPHAAAEAALPADVHLQGVFVGRRRSVLFVGTGTEPTSTSVAPSVTRTRMALQTVLSAHLLADRLGAEADIADDVALRRLAERVADVSWGRSRDLVISSSPLPEEVLVDLDLRVVVVPDGTWQGLLDLLAGAVDPIAIGNLVTAQGAVRVWAKDPRQAFVWHPFDQPSVRPANAAPSLPRVVARPDRTAASVMESIQEALIAGRFRPGDRITVGYISGMVKLPRKEVREALLSLASEGLVTIQPDRGVTIPQIKPEDIFETYAARRALGSLLVRRLCSIRRDDLEVLRAAVVDVTAVVATGDVWEAGAADFRFQDLMADVTGMRRIPSMFHRLSTQLRLFVSVMGLDYGYSATKIAEHLTALMAAIDARDEQLAAEIWAEKMRDAVAYWVAELDKPPAARRR